MIILKNLLRIIFYLFVFMLIAKSALNIVKAVREVSYKTQTIVIDVCPPKNLDYFKKFEDSDYLYALYRYKSMGEKCKK